MAQQQHSWDGGDASSNYGTHGHPHTQTNAHGHAHAHGHGGHKTPARAASNPLPYKGATPKSPRSYYAAPPSVYATPTQSSSSYGYGNYDQPPRSPKITTTYANDSCDEASSSTPSSYYQTPPSGSVDDSVSLLTHSPKSPCKFVFDAVSPAGGMDQAALGKKFEYYEPISPDDGSLYYEPPSSPRRQGSKKLIRGHATQLEQVPQLTTTGVAGKRRRDEWELPIITKVDARSLSAAAAAAAGGGESGGGTGTGSSGGYSTPGYYGLKRDSCVTECTQLSNESGETATQHTTTTTTSFSYTDTEGQPQEQPQQQQQQRRQRRHAINITSNPGYQVLHSSHSTLDRTCSDSVVSLRYRKSTSDLTQDAEHELSGCKPSKPKRDTVEYKPRRRGSSKGGLAYLASRRSSRESMKSACSNASIFSNDDIGPLAFQSSNRGRQRRTSNFLELPVPDHVRPRVCSLPERPYNPRASDDLYRLRHFSISKGNVVNCGDSIISRRSRSNTSVNSTNSRASERSPFEGSCCGAGYANVDSLPASPDDSESMDPPPPARYRVVMLGDAGVGKTALVNQFMTSEYMHTYDASLVLDDEFGEKTVSVLLDDEESDMVFIDHPSVEMSVENSLSTYEPHGCVVVFSVVDKGSFRIAEEIINYLWQENYTKDKAVILVGNKADLARARLITSQEGKTLAASRDAKFIETSSGIQHNVDELLVGILKQMRLKETREKKATSSKMKTSRTHISLHLAKEILQKICLSDISKSKSCENLHVL
ncbi:uncharacterized protein Dmoj_GI18451, isoform C [Drosophila mojavensis]|uniref:Uncharacterized protein, isoform B n=1 Tax=Drosophila mojavensis TaxID=7230 RepID=A0A0Q9XA36_DROMO|nr:uncharacterized protein Dmoj_GI18451, isoform B [Drosophila mojavensis]KRG05356.1 uncharacterized protein Dmoj_GI18451, isoform C [Drosophila mojavensis]